MGGRKCNVGTLVECARIGQAVLYRGGKVHPAPPEIANAKILPKLWADADGWLHTGDHCVVQMVDGLGERDVKAIANGPIMEPVRLYLPAGKLTEAEYQERLALDFHRAGLPPLDA